MSDAPDIQYPTGTVTFLLTDIEGSTRLLQLLGDQYPPILDAHYRLLETAAEAAGGALVSTEGDGMFFVFVEAASAVRAAIDAQRSLAAQPWPAGTRVRVRMGIHTGIGTRLGVDYVGLDVHRAARIAQSGQGGQIVLSDATRALVAGKLPEDVSLRALGEHSLKDLERPEVLFDVIAPGLETTFPALRTNRPGEAGLPSQLTTFIGRWAEREAVQDLLTRHRLVTLTGPGGTGKTRLAVEVARAAKVMFEGGVYFVPLATIPEADLFLPTLGSALGLREGPSRSIRDAIVEQLKPQPILLVLDNFEQLVPAAAAVADLLVALPDVTMLITSRERLRITGEQVFTVPALAVPGDLASGDVAVLGSLDSVALFVERSKAARSDFELNPANAQAVAEICARLDGLPLAIELAAARSSLFEPDEILRLLEKRMSFLEGGRDVPERQRTLRGAIDWSNQLLADAERKLFRRLSVFSGGASLEAIERVCGDDGAAVHVIDLVGSLHDKSLVSRDSAGGPLRIVMLGTIQEFALDQLEVAGEADGMRSRHANYFLSLAQRLAQELDGPAQDESLASLDRDVDNLRAAIRWSLDSREIVLGLRLATALERFWLFGNHVKEGRRVLGELLSARGSKDDRAVWAAAVGSAGNLSAWQSDYTMSSALADEALVAYRELGDPLGIARQLGTLAYAAVVPDPSRARELFEESLTNYRLVGQPAEMGQSLVGVALTQMTLGDVDSAERSLEQASELFRSRGDEPLDLVARGLQGVCYRLRGDLDAARHRYVDVLARAEKINSHLALTLPLSTLADLAILEGDPERAAMLDAAQMQVSERLGGTPTSLLTGIPSASDRAREILGDEVFEDAATRARAMPIQAIIELARSGGLTSRSD